MMRGLVLAKYGTQAASTRQRFLQAVPYLERENIHIEIQALFDNAYLETLFQDGRRNPLKILDAYRARLQALLTCGKFDFLWVHCELFPYLPGLLEGLIRYAKKPVIYDFDDAIFHQYDQHPNPLIRFLLGNKLVPLLRQSNIAFCGNAYLADYAKRHCRRTEIIPTTVDTTLYVPAAGKAETKNEKPTLGWIGSPSTWNYCLPFAHIFASLVTAEKLSMLVVGAEKAEATQDLPFEYRPWKMEHEVQDIQQMDIGIMPIPDEPWARGKCGYKLIQYMACGLPVIASPVGVNREIVEHGMNGLLASTKNEWREAIQELIGNPDLRQRMGKAGRAKIEQYYSIQVHGPRIARLIRETVS